MAELSIHILQASHNEKLAEFLLDKPFFDWAITACFYSAIHLFEARLFFDSADIANKHSESSIPVDANGEFKYSSHSWRAKQIFNNYSQKAWKAFRSLKEASETARYLSHYIDMKNKTIAFEKAPSFSIFRVENAKFALEKDLSEVRSELKIDLLEFLHSLDMEATDLLRANLISGKLMRNFTHRENLLNETKDSLRKYLTKEDTGFLDEHIRKKGLSFRQDSG